MHQIWIIDGPSLRSVLIRVRKSLGSDRKAANALGIGQSVFTRLRNGSVRKRMSFATYRRIRNALRRHGIESGLLDIFEESVLTSDGWFVQQHYDEWLRKELERLESKGRSVLLGLFSHQVYSGFFKAFLRETTRTTELPDPREQRVWMALYRAVEPLADTQLTSGVERTWQEMHQAGDLGTFLQSALRRERIMLARERDFVRFSKCSPSDAFLEELAGPEEEGARYMSPEEFFDGLDRVDPGANPPG